MDRRVQLFDATDSARELRVSDLRAHPFVVLLGEPGSGKSSVLKLEAEDCSTSPVTVRALMNDGGPPESDILFLDALDEYRIDGEDADKVQRLAKGIARAKASRWRLTCRSEDWRKGTDLAALERAVPGGHIVVAKLLPLDEAESAALLTAFGESDPTRFVAKADSLGAGSLLRSPLSLRLLHQVVRRDNRWPETRYQLFDAAVTSLAHEHNDDYKFRERIAPSDIVAAAEDACLLFLACGARAIWRSNSEPPRAATGDSRAYLTSHDLRLDHRVVADMLDTGLFTGEGEEFAPLHRSIAEFLAGRALAKLVTGSPSRAAFPFTRAVALITSADGLPPSELRGLYAWFAAHLSRQGHSAAAIHLIEADAATVLLYGDAAAFATDERRAILQQLDRHDPYFRVVESPDSVIGALAQPDLAADFADVLKGSAEDYESHRVSTVFDALNSGTPIRELRSLLREIALNPKRAEWDRARAADAWLKYADASPRELFDALEVEPPSLTRALLRLHVAVKLADQLTAAEIQGLLADFERTPNDNTVGRLTELTTALSHRAVEAFFDVPVASWMPAAEGRRHHDVEIEDALDSILIANIRATPGLTIPQLWSWINHLRGSIWSSINENVREAVIEWLAADPSRELELFDVILRHDETQEGAWQPSNAFIALTRTYPSSTLTRALLARATSGPSTPERKRLMAAAVEIIRRSEDADLYAEVERVLLRTAEVGLLERLQSGQAERQQAEDERRSTKRDDDKDAARENNVRILTPLVDELRSGGHPHHLHWAADVYLSRGGMSKEDDGNITRLRELTDDTTLTAILAGWDYLTTQNLIGADAAQLARVDAQNRQLFVESAAFAGLHRRLQTGDPPALHSAPIAVAFVAIRSRARLRNPQMRKRIFDWALNRLDVQPETGASELYAYWTAGLDAGAERLEPLWQLGEADSPRAAITLALDRLLTSRPSMPRDALASALRAALVHLPGERLGNLADRALGSIVEVGPQRRIWSFAAFALDPETQSGRFLAEHRDDADALFTDDLIDSVVAAFRGLPSTPLTAAAQREAALIELLGRFAAQRDEIDGWHRPGPVQIVRTAIRLLSSGSMPNAGQLLMKLADNPELAGWRSALRHARATWAADQREKTFRHPAVADVRAALQGGPPLSGSDLLAVVWEELRSLATESRSSENSSWKLYWNVDSSGQAERPVVENECRSRLLERLNDRLKRYDIVAAIPEAQRREATRADMLVLSHAARALPIEVKRHYHEDVWTAIDGQLQQYAQTRGSDGFGIYLVFWFGNDVKRPPTRPDGTLPESAEEFEALLKGDLTVDMRDSIRVVVFDVSRGAATPPGERRANSGISRQ